MLHDELLEKIQIFLFATELQSIDENFEGTKMLKALRAVVEMHKPFEDDVDECGHCGDDYPCPTIQAIEKSLS